jgi:ferric-dicitrate binding protein FerR (iron transport regulator)
MTPDFWDAAFMALLDRYVAGEATAAEAEQVREWLAQDPTHRAVLADVERVRDLARNRPPSTRTDAAWAKAVRELGLDSTTPVTPIAARRAPVHVQVPHVGVNAKRNWAWTAIAASLAIAASAIVIVTTSRSTPSTESQAQAKEFTTSRGQRMIVQLADGSELTIAPSSTVRVAADFGLNSRDLTLIGEAQFKVQHDATKPFRVRTPNGVVEDLGTEFNIDTYPETRGTQVVVASGKVALNGTALTRGQLGQLDKNGLVTVASNVDITRYFAWTRGHLSFHDTPTRDAFTRLSRWYDLDFTLADKNLESVPLTASFATESSAQVIKVLELTLRLRHEVHGRTLTFYPASTTRR